MAGLKAGLGNLKMAVMIKVYKAGILWGSGKSPPILFQSEARLVAHVYMLAKKYKPRGYLKLRQFKILEISESKNQYKLQ